MHTRVVCACVRACWLEDNVAIFVNDVTTEGTLTHQKKRAGTHLWMAGVVHEASPGRFGRETPERVDVMAAFVFVDDGLAVDARVERRLEVPCVVGCGGFRRLLILILRRRRLREKQSWIGEIWCRCPPKESAQGANCR